ncbi:right-handed parallel beta-helix repeat-containing protein [Bacteroides sp.]
MKKQILLSAILSFATFNMFAADLTVTSPSGDPAVEGSFPYIMASAQTDDVIKFNLSADEIEEFDAITVDSKSLTIDGLNQTTGNKIKFTGAKQTLSMKGACTILIKNCIFTGKNKAQALFVQTGANLNILDCEFIKNSHSSSGGVIGISQDVICSIKNCLFDGNSAVGGDGGCIRIYNNAKVTIENSTFKNNSSSASGGVIYMYSTNTKNETAFALTITNSTFVNNYAGNRGGAIYIYSRDTTKPLDDVKIINSTITANYSTKNLGGGIFVCSNTNCSSKVVLVNTIIAGNTGGLVDDAYFVPTDLGYWKGDKNAEGEIARDYSWEIKNCIFGAAYSTSDDTQLNNVDQSALFDNSSIRVTNFASSNIFTSLYKLDNTVFPDIEGDEVWSPALTNDAMPTAPLSENSIAIAKGTATYAGVTIPTTDQLGTTRPATPAIGAVEYGSATGILNTSAQKSDIRIWNDGNVLYAEGIENAALVFVYDLTGKRVYEGTIQNGASVTVNIEKGIYIAKVNDATAKLVIK